MNYIKRKLKTMSGLLTMILGLSILVLGVSYATFVITTTKYKASEMLISNLTYGINITGDGNSAINGKTVTVSTGKTTTLQIKITSLNDISSNYSLEYKIISGSGMVTYLSSTSYNPTGDINKTGTEKIITVVIEATTELGIEFNVSGGYTYNGTPSTLAGYTKITGTSHKVTVTSTNTNYGGVTNGSQIVSNNGTITITLSPKSGYEYSSNTCGGEVSGNTLTIKNITSNKECTVTFVKSIPDFTKKLLADNPTILERTDFSNVFTEENTGTLYKASGNETEDVDGDGIGEDVYYFAGNARNNWVKFGKDQDNADLYWRIIRTNEDGGIRLLYIGPDKATERAFIKLNGEYMYGKSYTYNSPFSTAMYVGYMYGMEGTLDDNRKNTKDSTIKSNIDLWYSNTLNIQTDSKGNIYDTYVSKTAIYCNDRSGTYTSSTRAFFGPYYRLYSNKKPSFKCGNSSNGSLYSNADLRDKFSVSTGSGGNGQLQYGISLITADEIAYAGGRYDTDSRAWFFYNSSNKAVVTAAWYTMSPANRISSDMGSQMFYVSYLSSTNSYLYYSSAYSTASGIRPVLSLKSCVKVTAGNGSSNTPYEVSVDSTCATAEN